MRNRMDADGSSSRDADILDEDEQVQYIASLRYMNQHSFRIYKYVLTMVFMSVSLLFAAFAFRSTDSDVEELMTDEDKTRGGRDSWSTMGLISMCTVSFLCTAVLWKPTLHSSQLVLAFSVLLCLVPVIVWKPSMAVTWVLSPLMLIAVRLLLSQQQSNESEIEKLVALQYKYKRA